MSKKHRSIEEQVGSAQKALNATQQDVGLQEVLSLFGYGPDVIRSAVELCEKSKNLVQSYQQKSGIHANATDSLRLAWESADEAYGQAFLLAQVAFKEDIKAQILLELTSFRKETLTGWRKQALNFYQNLLADEALLAGMARFGYTRTRLEQELALVTAVQPQIIPPISHKNELKELLQERDACLDELDEWMDDFRTVCRIVLADTPHLIEKLGFA